MLDLKQAARDRGLRQKDVAARLGVSKVIVSRWFCGHTSIAAKHITPLADILGVPPAAVLAVAVVRSAPSHLSSTAD